MNRFSFQTRSLWMLILLLASSSVSYSSCPSSDAQKLLHILANEWQGEAVITPLGPRSYDIHFQIRGENWIFGTANPGAALHHWGFYCEDNVLWLRFLSTFRGNTRPILFKGSQRNDYWFFESDRLSHVDVSSI